MPTTIGKKTVHRPSFRLVCVVTAAGMEHSAMTDDRLLLRSRHLPPTATAFAGIAFRKLDQPRVLANMFFQLIDPAT